MKCHKSGHHLVGHLSSNQWWPREPLVWWRCFRAQKGWKGWEALGHSFLILYPGASPRKTLELSPQ